MNKFFYLFVALVAIGFSSCSKDDVSTVTETGEPAALKLTISGLGNVTTKAVGPISTGTGSETDGTAEGRINSLFVAIFKCTQDGALSENDPIDGYKTFTNAEITAASRILTINNITAGKRSVLVVANYDNAALTALTNAKTRKEFLAVAVDLGVTTGSLTTTLGSTQINSYLPMSGEAKSGASNILDLTSASGSATVSLKRLVSQISISEIKTNFSAPYTNAKFVLKDIYIYNTLATSKVGIGDFSTTKPSSLDYLSGFGGTTRGYLCDAEADASNPIYTFSGASIYADPHYFYVFPTDGSSANPVKLVLYGTFDIDGDGGNAPIDSYYPIVINKTGVAIDGNGAGTGAVTRNIRYALKATINGIGSTGPNIDIVPANLSLTVNVEPWTNASQDVTFN
jgi:hypothetical protein